MDLASLAMPLIGRKILEKSAEAISETETSLRPEVFSGSFHQFGREKCLANRGSIHAFRQNLHLIYERQKAEERKRHDRQEEMRAPVRTRIAALRSSSEALLADIRNLETEKAGALEKKKLFLMNQLSEMRANPEAHTPPATHRFLYRLASVILVLLTAFLFLFYCSTGFSAFFREFDPGRIGLANALFAADTFSKALVAGWLSLLFTLAIPVVFISLGFLLHLLAVARQTYRAAAVIALAFLFDSALAYHILQSIHEVRMAQSFLELPPLYLTDMITDVRFHIIIFCGFVTYLVWGTLFHHFMEMKRNVNRADSKIADTEAGIALIETAEDALVKDREAIQRQLHAHQVEISKLEEELSTGTWVSDEYKAQIAEFTSAWCESINLNSFGSDLPIQQAFDEFVAEKDAQGGRVEFLKDPATSRTKPNDGFPKKENLP